MTELDPLLIRLYNAQRRGGPQRYICYSPFKSLFFGTRGIVTSCCYNRTTVLGRYPQDSIKEIWQGEQNRRLRERMARNDLSGGCEGCASQIRCGNYGAVIAQHYDRSRLDERYPTSMQFELHNTCNLECIMCSGELSSRIRKNRDREPPLEMAYDRAFVDQLEEFIPHLEEATFYGGEPFLIQRYYEIWDRMLEVNPSCEITVQTNGTVLTDRVRDYLERGNFVIGVSLDSIRRETFERIRVGADYAAVMENVQFFADYSAARDKTLGLSVCVMTQNWSEIPAYLEFADELGASVYFNTVWYPDHLSLAHASAATILHAWQLFEGHALRSLFKPGRNSDVAAANAASLQGYIALLKTWYAARAWTQQLGSARVAGSYPESAGS